jgi:hypothetical protein
MTIKYAHVSSISGSGEVTCCRTHIPPDFFRTGRIRRSAPPASTANPGAFTFNIVLASTAGIVQGTYLAIDYNEAAPGADKPVRSVQIYPPQSLHSFSFNIRGVIDASASLRPYAEDEIELGLLPRLRFDLRLELFDKLRFSVGVGRESIEEKLAHLRTVREVQFSKAFFDQQLAGEGDAVAEVGPGDPFDVGTDVKQKRSGS